ncbi:hypothetical protein RCL1_003943 [Eukaryota sp. TZLM3-RCL]
MTALPEALRSMRFVQRAIPHTKKEKVVSVADQWVLIKHPLQPSPSTVTPYEDLLCQKAVVGRRSFSGFNPSVEGLFHNKNPNKRRQNGTESEEISAQEMAHHYENIEVSAPTIKRKRKS